MEIVGTDNPEKLKDLTAQNLFGRSRNTGICVSCGSTRVQRGDFRDDLSRKEYKLSYMCQICQDEFFGMPEAL